MMPQWIDVGGVEDVPLRGSRAVKISGGEEIAIFRTGSGQIYALVNRCPHKHGPLSQGIVHGDSVTCPLHNWVISLATGEAQGTDTGCTPTIRVEVHSGRIMIERAAALRLAA